MNRCLSARLFLLVVAFGFGFSAIGSRTASADANAAVCENVTICNLLGNRTDRGTIGGGRNLIAYLNGPIWFGSYDLGPVFSLIKVDPEQTHSTHWWPDHLEVAFKTLSRARTPTSQPLEHEETTLLETRKLFITHNDVLATVITLSNPTRHDATQLIELKGEYRLSTPDTVNVTADTRSTQLFPNRGIIVLRDSAVKTDQMLEGLYAAVAASQPPDQMASDTPGHYQATWTLTIPAQSSKELIVTLAVSPDRNSAVGQAQLTAITSDLLGQNRQTWEDFFQKEVPVFRCSDKRLSQLWYFRWYLLRIHTATITNQSHQPVVLEHRRTGPIITPRCTPPIVRDLKWACDPFWAEGHLSEATHKQPSNDQPFTDGLLGAHALWEAYKLSGQRRLLERLYTPFCQQMRHRLQLHDPNNNGLWGVSDHKQTPPKSVMTSVYTYLDLHALARMADVLKNPKEARDWMQRAERTRQAIRSQMWDVKDHFFYDIAVPNDPKPARTKRATGFTPFLGNIAGHEHLAAFEYLLDPEKFYLPFPIPTISKNETSFDPTSNWNGAAQPAITCQVLDAFANAAKQHAPNLRKKAADLITVCVNNLFAPHLDFFEYYNPLTGQPLSKSRDYLGASWIDLIVRHVVGFAPRADGKIELNPLPPCYDWFELRNVQYQGHSLDITWRCPTATQPANIPSGYMLSIDGTVVAHANQATQLTWP